ncbi:MAG: NAD(P)H-dependent oxidoreductase [Flavobacteriia bacterium]|jgi:nitroreductase|nr:NAD(P)H-dependent oxidoreductase [Flavobacteriia bacterium]NBV68721.1 NAD(P)H-dependent oxidoreductase [Flavobacteriia bacterium]NBV91708.1 NAD(P)H-dependent oxidoreductase [Flavobacteriia bacterium]NBY40336.1 NAD(P)H-dependent oxidoreductase [Flavobacteriia bacterium]
MNNTLIQSLEWRYATKKFNPEKHVSEEDFQTLLASIRLTPTAFGLQPFKVFNITNEADRARLKEIAFNQSQVVDASHVLMLCSYTELNDAYLDNHFEWMAASRNVSIEKLDGFKNHVKSYVASLNAEQCANWTSKQAYLVLGQLLQTCALMGIDATPMEGFNAKMANEYFKLSEESLQAVLLCPIGYRDENDPYLSNPKFRKPLDQIFGNR